MRFPVIATIMCVISITLIGMVIQSFDAANILVTAAWWATIAFILLIAWIARQAESTASSIAATALAVVPVAGLISGLTWCETKNLALENSFIVFTYPFLVIVCACVAVAGVALLNEQA